MKLAGYNNVQIADACECSTQNVYVVSRSPIFVSEFNRQMQDTHDAAIAQDRAEFVQKARDTLGDAAPAAATRLVELMTSDDESVGLRASGSILDRALGPTTDKAHGGTVVNVQINTVDAQLLTTALKESYNASKVCNESSNGSDASPSED